MVWSDHDCTTEQLRISASLLILIEEVKCIRTAETKVDGVDIIQEVRK